MEKRRDLTTGVVMLIVSLLYLIGTTKIKVFSGMGSTVVDSTTIPRMWGICLIILSTVLIIRSMKKNKVVEEEKGKSKFVDVIKDNKEVVMTFILLAIYIGLLNKVGFIIMTALYIFFQILVLTQKEKRKYILPAVLALVFSLIIYTTFVKVLLIMLPRGIFGF